MVAMNPQTWDQDIAEIEPGGYLFYDCTKPLPASKFRDDINVIGMPLTEICNRDLHRPAPAPAVQEHHLCRRARRAARHGRRRSRRELIGEQYKGKEKLLAPNMQALQIGRDYALAPISQCPIGLRVKTRRRGRRPHLHRRQQRRGAGRRLWRRHGVRLVPDHALVLARRSVQRAIARNCASIRRPARASFAIIQAEDELASIGIVIGAGWNGARAFTATSGPGISLMQEFIGLAYFAEIPGGHLRRAARRPLDRHADAHAAEPTSCPAPTPRTATPSTCCCSRKTRTRPSSSPRWRFDLADRLQTPIFVMLDLDIGMNHRLCRPLDWDDAARLRPRQGDDARRTRSGQGVRPLSRRRRRRHPLPHLSRHASDQGLVLHPRHDQGPLRALYRGGRGLRRQHAAAAKKFETAKDAGAAARCSPRPP